MQNSVIARSAGPKQSRFLFLDCFALALLRARNDDPIRPGTALDAERARTIVITGAARGVGRAVAEACLRHGARLVLGDVLVEQGEQTARELGGSHADVRFFPVYLAEPAATESFAAEVRRAHGHIHGLVNNAAIATAVGGDPFEKIPIELWDRVMRVNVRGTWLVTRALTPRIGRAEPIFLPTSRRA
jgi:NAD(P)-dependent dehydrogenase (short-subunit alcohol dehydrogenase family)